MVSGLHLLVCPAVLPAEGGQVVFAVVGPREVQFEYGIRGELDRWTDAGWKHVCATSSSLGRWGGAGSLYAHGWRSIGLRVWDGVGPLEWLHIEGLEPGSYRIRHREVAGEFTVIEGDVALPWPVRERGQPHLKALRGVIRPGACTLTVAAGIASASTNAELDDALGRPAGPLAVRRWQHDAWGSGARCRVDDDPVGDFGNSRTFHAGLPALPPGTYQLSRRYTAAETVTGPLLVSPQ